MNIETAAVSTADVAKTLGAEISVPRRSRTLVIALTGLVVLVGGFWWLRSGSDAKVPKYVTQKVTQGSINVTVTATGNLQPRNQVDIGSELSGTMRLVNVDVNDEVQAGQVLASLDTARLRAQVLQAESSLASAQARVTQTEATLKEARANYQRLAKLRELSDNKLPSQQDLDVSEAAVARGEGETVAAKASVAQAQASLTTIRTDLGKAEIRSPINGVVLVRSVEPGQTVAASLQAPILFTLAEDLKKMELHVSVDEADVGSVEIGQRASFSVDAFPNRNFSARITQVHFASNNTQKAAANSNSPTATGVVTYETVLEVDNSELLLRPGMTATAQILTTSINDAVLVPNAALRFTPEGVELPFPGGGANGQNARGPLGPLMPQMGGRPRNNNNRESGGGQGGGGSRRPARAWIIENGKPELAMFRPGATDGRVTQVLPMGQRPNAGRMNQQTGPNELIRKALERKLTAGMEVIVDTETAKSK
jgi:HlyD family secretion protein